MVHMKRLIICNTYYQLILAVQMRQSMFQDDVCDLWLSDHSKNAENIAQRITSLGVFSSTRYITTKAYTYQNSTLEDILEVIRCNFGKIHPIEIDLYDEIIFYNVSLKLYQIQDYYKKIGHVAKWSLMEEGIFSYSTDFTCGNRVNLTRKLRKFTHRDDLIQMACQYYCTNPELKKIKTNCEIIKIPSSDSSLTELRDTLNYIFNFDPDRNGFRQKYIYFASSSDIDGNPYGETEFVLRLVRELGRENLLVKMHPRDLRSVYEDEGITVTRDSSVPWEVIQMNLDLSNKTLLTINSGAFISISTIMDSDVRGYLLFPFIKNGNAEFCARSQMISEILEQIHHSGHCINISVLQPDHFEDIKNE